MSVLAFGEIVWDDITPRGGSGKAEHLGGAPLNVVANCAKLGLKSAIVSALGADGLGKSAGEETAKLGIRTGYLSQVPQKTCLIEVKFQENGEPEYWIPPDVSWDHICVSQQKLAQIDREKYPFFYYGTLSLRSGESRRTVERILALGFREVFCDLNLRPPHYTSETVEFCLSHCTIAKLNEGELEEISQWMGLKGGPLKERMEELAERYGLKRLIVTRGGNGAEFLSEEGFGTVEGISVKVADTVGAGDGFSAGFLYSISRGASFAEACGFANALGSFIATKTGSVPDYTPEEFLAWRERHEI